MWPRIIELLLGLWLLASPIMFAGANTFWWNEVICGSVIVLLSLLSFWRPARWAHLVTGPVALWLGGFAYFAAQRPGPPGAQNDITIAWLLLTMFILPNESSLPPEPWRQAQRNEPDRKR